MATKTKIYTGGNLMKKLMLICAPLSSRSGYGDHARDLFHSFHELDEFKIQVLDVRWGNCPRNALNPSNEKDKLILDAFLNENKLDRQPDVYVDIRIPNEFETYGKYNIGITAGIETDVITPEWVDGCNKMDLIIVPSEHSKHGIVNTIYDKIQNRPDGNQEKVGDHRVVTPVEVLFEGVDTDTYKQLKIDEIDNSFLTYIDDIVKEDFAFLTVGLWGGGGYGEDRKNIGKTIKIFYEAFANKKKKPALLLKTNGAGFSELDRADTLKKINNIKDNFPSDFDLPNVYLLHGDLTKTEMNYLYNHPKIKCLLSLTHGEGFGRPLLEATMVGLPVITTGWSGQLDFLNTECCNLLRGQLVKVPESAVWDKIITKDAQWFEVDDNMAYNVMNKVFTNYFDTKRAADKLKNINVENFSMGKMNDEMKNILERNLIEEKTIKLPNIKLPKLKKIGDVKSSGIKLPKLKTGV